MENNYSKVKSYNEIRELCKLTAYTQQFAAKGCIYCEQYEDENYIYDCLFPDFDLQRELPFTIYVTEKKPIQNADQTTI